MTILKEIKKGYSKVFRRMYLKRRSSSTGLFETNWVTLTSDVQSWGKTKIETDSVLYGKFRFSDIMPKMDNSEGRYNPSDNEFSLWYSYGDQQRSLIRIDAGFDISTVTGGVWTHTEVPTTSSIFYGIVSGDIPLTGVNAVTLPVRPLLQIFRDYPARNLTGFTTTGLTASQFMTMVRDQTDGAGLNNYIFRPFFNNTTSQWNIETTTQIYTNLATATATDVFDKSVWDVMEKLAISEDKTIFVKRDGSFNFITRDLTSTISPTFKFFGIGFVDTEYGQTVKKITRFGKKQSDYYSRVAVKFVDADTTTSLRVQETGFTVTGANAAWNLGHRTYNLENFWLANTAAADAILSSIYNRVSVVKDQIEFVSTFVPHLEILDKIQVSYDSGPKDSFSRWDGSDWAQTATDVTGDLIWSDTAGDAIRLVSQDFKILSIEQDLDKLETKIWAITV